MIVRVPAPGLFVQTGPRRSCSALLVLHIRTYLP